MGVQRRLSRGVLTLGFPPRYSRGPPGCGAFRARLLNVAQTLREVLRRHPFQVSNSPQSNPHNVVVGESPDRAAHASCQAAEAAPLRVTAVSVRGPTVLRSWLQRDNLRPR